MTVLYGAAQGIQAMKSEAYAKLKAKDVRYLLRSGSHWLHWSGLMLTSDRKQAWSGTFDQGKKCRRTFDAAAGCKMVSEASLNPKPLPVEAVL